ncbi:MAG: molybdopterin dinucleotide binding domain-containing protein [Candidatus Hodarchaeota archaeon]
MSDDESFYRFLVPKIKLLASIVRTVPQSVISDKSITSLEYLDALAICLIHPDDMKLLGIKEGNIKLTSEFGSVIVKAIESEKDTEKGIIFLPLGPWANQISGLDNKTLRLKNLEVKVEVTNDKITDIKSLFEK